MRITILCLFVFLAFPAVAQEGRQPEADQQRLVASDPAAEQSAYGSFGRSMVLDGDTAVVAAPGQHTAADWMFSPGAVYVFRRIGFEWVEEAALYPPEGDQAENFGAEMALDGDTLVISEVGINWQPIEPGYYEPARWEDYSHRNRQTLYTYKRVGSTWTLASRMEDFTFALDDRFGHSLALAGDTLAVGAYNTPLGDLENAGAIYMFHWDGTQWINTERIDSPENESYVTFGFDVELDDAGDTMLVGQHNWYKYAWIYNFDGSSWALQSRLTPPPCGQGCGALYVGVDSLSPDGRHAAVMTLTRPNGNQYEVTWFRPVDIWAFDGTTWSFEQRLDAHGDNSFGWGFDLSDDAIIVSSAWEYEGAPGVVGGAYIYRHVGRRWTLDVKLIAFDEDMPSKANTNSMVALSGGNALSSVFHRKPRFGRAYAFRIPGIEQNLDLVAGRSDVLPLPSSPQTRDSSGYTTFEVSLKSRPSRSVDVKLTASKSTMLLDNGGAAAPSLILHFTRQNWDIPQTIRARSAGNTFAPLTASVRENILSNSAVEYRLVMKSYARVSIPADTFALDTPVSAATLTAPSAFTWQPYALATGYTLKIQLKPNGKQFAFKLDAAAVCNADLCSFTPDGAFLKPGRAYRWRVVAKDAPAKFQKATGWRSFTVANTP